MPAPSAPLAQKISDVLNSPCTSFWLSDALRAAMDRDPVDAANDAEVLAELLKERLGNFGAKRPALRPRGAEPQPQERCPRCRSLVQHCECGGGY